MGHDDPTTTPEGKAEYICAVMEQAAQEAAQEVGLDVEATIAIVKIRGGPVDGDQPNVASVGSFGDDVPAEEVALKTLTLMLVQTQALAKGLGVPVEVTIPLKGAGLGPR